MIALRRMSRAFGGLRKLADDADLNATALYRTLSPKGNPELRSLTALLHAMGMQLAVRPLPKKGTSPRAKRPASPL
jgi:DNA-binding phage protein